jgi:hypothetical protein
VLLCKDSEAFSSVLATSVYPTYKCKGLVNDSQKMPMGESSSAFDKIMPDSTDGKCLRLCGGAQNGDVLSF